jgi:uncharacterized protein (TIGR02147 family)
MTASIFATDDYRTIVQEWVASRGRGEYRRIAAALKMHTTLVSQVFNGRKCLTEEQASRLCDYLGLDGLEGDCFLKLVQLERAGDESLRARFRRHLKQLRAQAKEAKSRVPEATELSEQDRAIFYSSWQYSLVRLATSIEGTQTVPELSSRLSLSRARVNEILGFLVARGLCVRDQNGRYRRTEKNTHVEASSPLAVRHHQNWRAKALELLEHADADDFSFTAPVSLSRKDIPKVRERLLDAISEIAKTIENSGSEELVYLGMDWIKV